MLERVEDGMRRVRTCRWTRMRRSHALSRPLVASSADPSYADCITNMFRSNLRQAHLSPVHHQCIISVCIDTADLS